MIRLYHFFLLLVLLFNFGCNSEEEAIEVEIPPEVEIPQNEESGLSFIFNNTSPYETNITIENLNNLSNLHLLAGSTSNLEIGFSERNYEIPSGSNSFKVKKLLANTTYNFRLAAVVNDSIYYSDVKKITTSEITVSYNSLAPVPIASETFNYLKKVKEVENGYVLATQVLYQNSGRPYYQITKLNNAYGLEWSIEISEIAYDSTFVDFVEQPNGAGIFIYGREYWQQLPGYQSYVISIDLAGNIQWKKYYNQNNELKNIWFYDFDNAPNSNRFIARIGSITGGVTLFSAWEVEIDANGEVIFEKTFDKAQSLNFSNIKFDTEGNMYNYGVSSSWEKILEKYGSTGNLSWSQNYGQYFPAQTAGNFYYDDDKIIYVHSIETVNHSSNHIFKTNNTGEIVWEYKISEDKLATVPDTRVRYNGIDVLIDNDEYICLYDEFYSGNHKPTLTSLNEDGEVLWKFETKLEEFPQDFSALKYFKKGEDSYVLFGNWNFDGVFGPYIIQYTFNTF